MSPSAHDKRLIVLYYAFFLNNNFDVFNVFRAPIVGINRIIGNLQSAATSAIAHALLFFLVMLMIDCRRQKAAAATGQ